MEARPSKAGHPQGATVPDRRFQVALIMVLSVVDFIEDPEETAAIFDDGTLTLDFARGEVTFRGKQVELTPTEYKLLVALVRHRGQHFGSRELCELAGVETWVSRGNIPQIKNEMADLREKFHKGWGWYEDDSPIKAVRGRGWAYRSLS